MLYISDPLQGFWKAEYNLHPAAEDYYFSKAGSCASPGTRARLCLTPQVPGLTATFGAPKS